MDPGAEGGLAQRYSGRTVLAIGAHPDDVEIAVGGTVARWSCAGCRVVIAVVSVPHDYATRRREAERAARILGCELRVLVDGCSWRVEDLKAHELVGLLDEQIRELAPAAVLVHGSGDFHRDHVLVHEAALCSQQLQHFDCFCYQPSFCRPIEVPFIPRVYVDVSETIDTKMAAIEAHESQFSARGIKTDMYREMAHLRGGAVGVAYAEGLEIERMLIS
jgi:LmbE family N-acetylglucosaminyl deacetylase